LQPEPQRTLRQKEGKKQIICWRTVSPHARPASGDVRRNYSVNDATFYKWRRLWSNRHLCDAGLHEQCPI
jgi:transposase-like protein